MSWQTINEVIGLAATDERFAQELIADPLETMRRHGYQLTAAEQEAFRLSASQTLDTFSQNLLRHLSQIALSHKDNQEKSRSE